MEKKLTTLESLFSEQEYTVIALDKIVSRQDQAITRLSEELKWVKSQLLNLKEHLPNDQPGLTDEKPPHY
jgi:uncharacterized coiled-coil protein SlyX